METTNLRSPRLPMDYLIASDNIITSFNPFQTRPINPNTTSVITISSEGMTRDGFRISEEDFKMYMSQALANNETTYKSDFSFTISGSPTTKTQEEIQIEEAEIKAFLFER